MSPAENFVAQIAFTQLNSFILTTDGRVFSWGGATFCLGRDFSKTSDNQIDEIDIFESPVVKLATGRSHLIALDVKGRVYAWGKNDYGQLGLGDKVDREYPTRIESVKNITQIYSGENMSFAVNKFGEAFAWGQNKHDQLLINSKKRSFNQTDTPQIVQFPDYF